MDRAWLRAERVLYASTHTLAGLHTLFGPPHKWWGDERRRVDTAKISSAPGKKKRERLRKSRRDRVNESEGCVRMRVCVSVSVCMCSCGYTQWHGALQTVSARKKWRPACGKEKEKQKWLRVHSRQYCIFFKPSKQRLPGWAQNGGRGTESERGMKRLGSTSSLLSYSTLYLTSIGPIQTQLKHRKFSHSDSNKTIWGSLFLFPTADHK